MGQSKITKGFIRPPKPRHLGQAVTRATLLLTVLIFTNSCNDMFREKVYKVQLKS